MRAADLQVALPVVRRETNAVEAGRLIADSGLVGLVIANKLGVPTAIVSAVDVLRLMVPGYLLDDVSLAAVFDEAGAGELWEYLAERTVGEMLDDEGVAVRKILSLESDATLVEIAARMVDARTQIALVRDSPRTPRCSSRFPPSSRPSWPVPAILTREADNSDGPGHSCARCLSHSVCSDRYRKAAADDHRAGRRSCNGFDRCHE
nr:hypothetical protein [Pseudarthrobacter psychrotolerans]